MRWGSDSSAWWPQQCKQRASAIHKRCHEISLPPKKGGPFGLTVVASAAVRTSTCRSRCRLSNLRTHSVRTKAVSSGCVVCMGVNGAMGEEQHNNRRNVDSPAVERPREERLKAGFQL
eukprot:1821349-Prymnesium_polylepis.1